MRILLLFFLSVLAYLPSHSQDTLLLMNGKSLGGKINDQSATYILLEIPRKKGGTKMLSYDREEIYSFRKSDRDSIVYQEDPLLGFDLSQQDMRNFMHGQDDARNGHPMLYNQLGGFALGLGSTIALDGGAVPFIIPIAYSLGMQIPIVRVKDSAISDRESALSPYYLEGYNATARSKKLINGFLSTMAGVVLGSAIVLLSD